MRNFIQALFLALGILSVVLAIYSFATFAGNPPPFEYVTKSYAQVTACAGDTLVYPLAVAVHRAPSVVEVNESWFDVDGGFTAIADLETSISVHTQTTEFTRTVRRKIPDTLKPGRYEFRQGGHESNGGADAYSIPVVIVPC